MQIKKLADELGVSVTLIKHFLRGHPSGKGRTFAGAEESLDREQERAVREAHAAGLLKRNRGATTDIDCDSEVPDAEVDAADLEGLKIAAVARYPLLARGDAKFPVYLHTELLEWLLNDATPEDQRKIFTRRVQELMAHGHASRTKGTRGKNAGWLRTPLGGNSGNHFYLWFANHGETVRGQEDATRALHDATPPRSRFLRLARHHDETKHALEVGSASDYAPLEAQKALEGREDGLIEPLVSAQRTAVDDLSRVRILVGRPGAGKTTALQAAASTLAGRALYVTWSAPLAARAREWFAAFGPAALDVEVWTFRQVLERVDGTRSLPGELSLSTVVSELRAIAEPILSTGPWRHRGELRAEELYAELHAHLIGCALPVAFAGRRACKGPALTDIDYRTLRASIGEKACEDALRVLRKLEPEVMRRLFAAPVAAFERARALQDGSLQLDASFAFDWVLVDEVQDLTLAEQWLLVDVAARSGKVRGVAPGMVVAGDEAQTVRPTAFEFGRLSLMIDARLGARSERKQHELVENLRSPKAVGEIVDRADDVLYALLPRVERPRGRRSGSPADVTPGKVARVEVNDDLALTTVFETFKALEGEAALVYPAALAPEHMSRRAREVGVTLWTSETIKGLEYRTVGVLEMPREVERIVDLAASTKDTTLSVELARSSADRMLVALSRATETLILFGSAWASAPSQVTTIVESPEDASASSGYLGEVHLADLSELLEIDAADAIGRIEKLLENSERLEQLGELEDAVRQAENARGLLGDEGRPGSVGRDLRNKTHRRFAVASIRSALRHGSLKATRKVVNSLRDSDAPGTAVVAQALAGMLSSKRDEAEMWKRTLEVVRGLASVTSEEPALRSFLLETLRHRVESVDANHSPPTPSGRRALLETLDALATDPSSDTARFRDEHQRVLSLILRQLVTRTDKVSRDEYAAYRAGVTDTATLAALDAEHSEAQGDLPEAARRWELAGHVDAALRCARRAGDLQVAARLAEAMGSEDAAILAWAHSVAQLLAARPTTGTLTEAETRTIAESLETMRSPATAKRARV